MNDLTALRADADDKLIGLICLVAEKFPGRTKWDWSRACAATRGENVRRNDDQSDDAALAADTDLRAAHDAYIAALHAFYAARDGAGGFLGGRGL